MKPRDHKRIVELALAQAVLDIEDPRYRAYVYESDEDAFKQQRAYRRRLEEGR